MTSPALWTFLQQERLSGSEAVVYHEMEWYRRTAYPFSVYILVLIAVALASEKRRGGIGAQIAIGLLLAVTYIFVMQLSSIFVASPYISPWLAVWMPNLLFAALGGYLYLRAAK
jgi:lipopolysaccharide export system permease protein